MLLAPPSQRRRALDANYTPWVGRSLSQHLGECARRFGDAPFVITDSHSFSYAEMHAWSTRLAVGLVNMGIRSGEHVAVVMANYPEFVALKFAISMIGAVSVPANFLLRERELSYVLDQSDAVALITMDRYRDLDYLAALDSLMPGWEQHGGGPNFPKIRNVVVFNTTGERSREWQSLEDLEVRHVGTSPAFEAPLAFDASGPLEAAVLERDAQGDHRLTSDILYTSGTTGTSKGVLLTNDMVLRAGYASAYGRGLTPGFRTVYSLPMYHVFGYIECLLAVSYVGGAVIPRLVFDAADMLSCVAKHGANEISCVPTMTLALLDEARSNAYDLSSLAIMYSSGGVAPATIFDDMAAVLAPQEMVHGYGQTETTAAMSAALSSDDETILRTTNGIFRAAGAAGDPDLGGVLAVYKAVDVATGEDLAAGERGELVVRGPAVTVGYYNKPEETAAAIDPDGWLHTGDLGIVDERGCVSLVGRVKETYRCGGEMVMPREVELLLEDFPGVSQVHVVGIPHERMGEIGCAVIVADPENIPDPVAVIERCSRELARFKVPRHVVFMDAAQLPLTVTGRVQKFKLSQMVVDQLVAQRGAQS